jgi:NAD(P)-dependent dehydrogenase (short-subunit alcohol dehydrogenase family)
MTHIDLSHKNILITGASKGIGRAIAEYAMQMDANVAVHYNSDKASADASILKYPKVKSKVYQANLANTHEVVDLFKAVERDFEKIDVVILNAGVFLEHSTKENFEDWLSIWKSTISINLDAVGILTKLGIDHFRKHKGGRFIFIGSRAVFRGETEEYLAYAASKGGLTSLARSVARSFGKENIKSFVIAPGFTRTQMAESFIKTYGEERVLNEIALNQLTKPNDIAPLVALMCSGDMDHATGATIDVNAGSHIR